MPLHFDKKGARVFVANRGDNICLTKAQLFKVSKRYQLDCRISIFVKLSKLTCEIATIFRLNYLFALGLIPILSRT